MSYLRLSIVTMHTFDAHRVAPEATASRWRIHEKVNLHCSPFVSRTVQYRQCRNEIGPPSARQAKPRRPGSRTTARRPARPGTARHGRPPGAIPSQSVRTSPPHADGFLCFPVGPTELLFYDNFLEPIQPDLGGPVFLAKTFRFPSHPNHLFFVRPSRPTRGAYRDRHGRWVRDAMNAEGARTNGAGCGRRNCVWS